MPESRSRRQKKAAYKAPTGSSKSRISPPWWAPTMVTVMILGGLWVVIYYLSGGAWPIEAIGGWNLAVGFGLVLAGFGMTSGWY
ncbi:MAG: cell division protein CrgA [Bifidobacteriaceae bacterium]|nr:cell division protein CrgA [Bifidobacteriaceae bacterium]